MSRWKPPRYPREHETTRAIIRTNVNARSFALSKRLELISPSEFNSARKRRSITLAEHT
jgi:hypothetical protein